MKSNGKWLCFDDDNVEIIEDEMQIQRYFGTPQEGMGDNEQGESLTTFFEDLYCYMTDTFEHCRVYFILRKRGPGRKVMMIDGLSSFNLILLDFL